MPFYHGHPFLICPLVCPSMHPIRPLAGHTVSISKLLSHVWHGTKLWASPTRKGREEASTEITARIHNLHSIRCRRPGFDSWVGKIPWRRKYNPLQYSCLENPMDRGAWWATVHGVMSQTWLSETTTNICIKYALHCHDTKVMHVSSNKLQCKQLWKEERQKAKEKREDISIWIQSSKE